MKTVNSGTKYHNQTDTLVNELPSNTSRTLSHSQLIHTTESAISNQAIDVSLPPGAIDARFVRTLMTPSGMKPVIILTDEDIDLDVQHDYVPGVCLPEQGHVWSDRFESASEGGEPAISESVAFSQRTGYYMLPFKYYNSHVLVRLICKPAFSQAQSYWVSRSFDALAFGNNRHINEIGFNWLPSLANEIFVLMPWSDPNYIVETDADPAETFGYLNVRNLTNLVTSTGNDVPLSISYYFAPYKMYTYVPQPVTTTPPTLLSGSITILPQDANIPVGTTVRGDIEIFEPTYLILRTYSLQVPALPTSEVGAILVDSTMIGEFGYYSSSSGTNLGNARISPVLFQPGTYPVATTATLAGTAYQDEVAINWINITGQIPTYTPLATGTLQIDSSPQTKEIQRGESSHTIVFNSVPDHIDLNIEDASMFKNMAQIAKHTVVYENLPTHIELNPKITNPISQVCNGFNMLTPKFKTSFSTCVVSQSPDLVMYTLYHENDVVFATFAKSKALAKLSGYKAILDYYVKRSKRQECVDDLLTFGTEQIFEYQYNSNSEKAKETYGKMYDNNPREDHHNMFLQELEISATNKYVPFNFNLDLSVVAATYPYVNTREYLRHYLKSHMPVITIKSNKNPFSNLLCRLVQGTYSSYEDVMQLPGSEWDPTRTNLQVQPYWKDPTPAVTQIVIPFTLVILSGQIDVSGMQLLIFFNTSTLNYHHKIDYDPSQPAVVSELTSVLNELGMCSKCSTAPCQCSKPIPSGNGRTPHIFRRKPRIIEGVTQGIESETITEQVENQSLDTRSPQKLDGVTMETSRIHDTLETGKTQIEKDYHFVGAISTPLSLDLRFIAIPISHNAFGKMEVTSAKKYRYWQGEPTFKVTLTASSVLPGIVYLAQVPPDFDLTSLKAESALRMYSSTQEVFWNSSVELPIKWYDPIRQKIVDYTIDPAPPQLGYIVLAFPTPTGSTFGSGDQNIKITVHCDTSNIGYSRPSYSYPNFDYPGLQFTVYTS